MAEADIAGLAHQLLQLRTGSEIIAFRKRLSKDVAQAVIRHPLIGPLDRAAILLAIKFNGEPPARRNYNSSGDGFAESLISTSEDLSHASETSAQDARKSAR